MGLFGTSASLFADISLLLEAVILAGFFIGWSYGKKKRSKEHQSLMTGAFALNVAFVGAYMIRSLLGEGGAAFQGPDFVKDFIYLPTVIVHGIASLLAFLLAAITLFYGYTRSVMKKRRVFPSQSLQTRHKILGVLTISTWSLSFTTGIFVYALLYLL